MDRPYNAPAASEPRRSYLLRHWRGELSLTRTFWLNGVALRLLFMLLNASLLTLMKDASLERATVINLALLIVGLSLVLWIWQLVGLWRCARRHSQLAGVVIPLLIVALLAHYAYPFVQGFIPGFTKGFNEQLERNQSR